MTSIFSHRPAVATTLPVQNIRVSTQAVQTLEWKEMDVQTQGNLSVPSSLMWSVICVSTLCASRLHCVHMMWPVISELWSLSVTTVSCTKMAEPTMMSFLWTLVDQRNHPLGVGADFPRGRGAPCSLWGRDYSVDSIFDFVAIYVICLFILNASPHILLFFTFSYFSPPLLVSFQNRLTHFHATCRKRRLNLALVLCCSTTFLSIGECVLLFVRFSFFHTKPRDWLGEMSPK